MNRARITDVFSQAPASFQFQEAKSGDGPRLLGASPGAAIQLDGSPEALTRAILSVVTPHDNLAQARRGGTLLMLLMVAFAPKWGAGHKWMTGCLNQAARGGMVQEFKHRHLGWRYTLKTDRTRALVTLTIAQEV